MKVKAYAAHSASSPLQAFSFTRRNPGAGDVTIAIDYCGICHSDIHQARNEWHNSIYPVVPGHEIVGHVTAVGAQVTKFSVGQAVGVGCLVDSCRTCSSCQQQLQQYCENGFTLTYNSAIADGTHTYGGYSTHIVVDQDFVLRVPENLTLSGVAPLLCAGITTYSPMKHVGVSRGQRVGVVGLGGLGHMAVKLAASFGAEVSVLSRTLKKADDAKRLGALDCIATSNDTHMSKLNSYFDVIVDTVSAKHDVNALLGTLKRDGTLIMVGAADQPLDLQVFPLILGRRSILGSLIGGIDETQQMLDHCGHHNITSDVELIEPSQINDAYEKVIAGQVKYRFVIDCQKF